MPLVELGPLHQGRSDAKEVFKLVNEIRAQVNLLPDVFSSILQTAATGTPAMIWGRTVEDDTAVKLTASVVGTTSDLSQGCAYTLEVAVVNAGGVLSIIGGTEQQTFVRETAAGTNAAFVISGLAVLLNVTDAGALTTYWRATVYAEQIG